MGTPEVGPLGLHSLLVRAGDYVGNLAGTTDKAPYRQLRAWRELLQVVPVVGEVPVPPIGALGVVPMDLVDKVRAR